MLKMGYHYSWPSLHGIIVVALKWMRYDPILKDNILYNKWASDFSRVDKMKVDTNFCLGRDHLKNKLEREILQAEVGFSRHWQKLSSSIGSMLGSRWSGVIPTCSHTRVNSHTGVMNSITLEIGEPGNFWYSIKSTRWVYFKRSARNISEKVGRYVPCQCLYELEFHNGQLWLPCLNHRTMQTQTVFSCQFRATWFVLGT